MAKCPICPGMPQWWVPEPYVNLELADTPLSYTMSSGKEMEFTWYYDQHYQLPKIDEIPNWYYYIGSVPYARADPYATARTCGMTNAAWAHNWMLNIVFWDTDWENSWGFNGTSYTPSPIPMCSRGYEALVFRPEGGVNYFYNFTNASSLQDSRSQMRLQPVSTYPLATNLPASDTNKIYWGDANMGFKLLYPDGSQDIFGFTLRGVPSANIFGGGGSSTAQAFLTQRIDPQGRVTRIGYERQRDLHRRLQPAARAWTHPRGRHSPL